MELPTEMLIRERAYSIWLREGCPPDAAGRNWEQAVNELAELGNGGAVRVQPDGEGPSGEDAAPVIVAGPTAQSNEAKPKARPRKRKPADETVIVAGPEAHANEKP